MASLLGMSRVLNRTPILFVEDKNYEGMWKSTKEAIPGLIEKFQIVHGKVPSHNKPIQFSKLCCVYVDPRVLENMNDEFLHLDSHFYQSWKYFAGMQRELIGYVKKSGNYSSLPRSTDNVFVTCAHVRRGDFLSVGFAVADERFVINALDFMEKKDPSTHAKKATVLFGDTLEFLELIYNSLNKNKSSTTYFIAKNRNHDDLLYAKENCDAVLIASPHSTFGWWMGYLSKGNKVYYMDIRETNDPIYRRGELNPYDYFAENWTPLKYDIDNQTIIRSIK
ncbi:L-Fucosyltransferase [Caenorhabditis elegans]|nr:L-Fucosyltransferase [Caenorhabditis elegans]CCD73880.2 L-Fucosyltransferase [Caenorhabditis elegans]|eukprot:NP_001122740.2 Uncharacterized protein CELE_Y71H2AM.14 [Caenorhabditis elegans]